MPRQDEPAAPPHGGDPFVLVGQLTDTHVVALDADGSPPDELYVDNNARLTSAVSVIGAEAPALAAVVLTGDLTNWGRPAEFDNLASLLSPLAVPLLPIPGNHDDRDLLRSTFPHMPWVDASHASWVTTIAATGVAPGVATEVAPAGVAGAGVAGAPTVRIIGLDSTIPGRAGASFDVERESWLRSVLADAHDGPTLLAVHHPPFTTGVGWMDRSGFIGVDRLAAVLAEHPVDRILCGHFHRPISSTIAGIPVQVCLSTVQHVDLDLAPGAGVSLIVDPVGYQIHRIARSGIVTHTRYIDTGAERIIPTWAADF